MVFKQFGFFCATMVLIIAQINWTIECSEDPDIHRTTDQLIESRGYVVETHQITTEDGYILTYFRIPHGKVQKKSSRGPVLLQHGLTGSSFNWFIQNDDHILPFLLAEEGYDVWIGNARGTSYSLLHVNLTENDPAYWKFSWQEMGQYDTPAAIDYILSKSLPLANCIFYIGHSMGTTQFFVMLALRPEYNSKICLMSAYAPVAYLSYTTSPIRALGPVAALATVVDGGDLVTELGVGKALPDVVLNAIHKYGPVVCSEQMAALNLCENLFFVISGFDERQANASRMPVVAAHCPDSTSVNTFIHYGQEINSGRFAEFEHGILSMLLSLRVLSVPQSFDPAKMTAPIAFYRGDNDELADPTDVAKFAKQLPNLVRNYRVPIPEFNHFDFLSAIDAYDVLYKTTIEFMNTYSSIKRKKS